MERSSEQDGAVGDAETRSGVASTGVRPDPIPVSVFEGTLRRVNLTRLTPLQRRVFDYAFPVFNAEPTLNDPSAAAVERAETVERPYNYRRFAGGGELPRGCYASELVYYADPRALGRVLRL